MKKVLLFGEPMALLTAEETGPLETVEHFTRSMSGAEVNVSIGLKRLGFDVTYITKLGNDVFGKYLFHSLEKEGFDLSNVSFSDDFPSGIQLKGKNLNGDPEIAYYRAGSAASRLNIQDIENIDFTNIETVHITGIPPALSDSCLSATYYLIEKAKQHHVSVSFDPNLRLNLWRNKEVMIDTINDIAMKCDIVLPGIEEGVILTNLKEPKEIADFYIRSGVETVVIKAGSEGAYAVTKDYFEKIKGFEVSQVVDTVGAGDGFAVGIISGRLDGLTLRECVQRANGIGAIQVMHKSDNEGLPTRQELQKFMSGE